MLFEHDLLRYFRKVINDQYKAALADASSSEDSRRKRDFCENLLKRMA
jgi:hypothetical protein